MSSIGVRRDGKPGSVPETEPEGGDGGDSERPDTRTPGYRVGHRARAGIAETAVLLVSELVTNAYQATGIPADPEVAYSQLADAPVITLSLRHSPPCC